jgi:uncharacterized protein
MDFLPRHITPRLKEALKASPVVYLNGARQTGKSTLVKTIEPTWGAQDQPAVYFTFDRPTTMAAAAAAPEAFLTSQQQPMIIDEVQLVPELFRALKTIIDERRFNKSQPLNGQYLLTGSANILALPKLADALVGRATTLTLYPYTVAEANQQAPGGLEHILKFDFTARRQINQTLLQAMQVSTFPEIAHLAPTARHTWFDGYISMMLQRDVKQLAALEKANILPHLLSVLAARAGGLINDADIARDINLNHVTTKFYRNILKMMYLTFDVKPWYRNVGKRLVKTPKGYLMDTSMICHLLNYNLSDTAATKPEIFGHLVENFIATEILKQLSHAHFKAELYHFRTSDGKEVDFILEKPDGSVFAIEVKKAETVSSQDFKGIRAFQELVKEDFLGGVVLYAGKEAVPFGKNLWAVPFDALW